MQFLVRKQADTSKGSVPDPNSDPDPPDPHVSSSKKSKKNLGPTVLWLLLDFLSLKNDVNVPSKRNEQKNFFKISLLFLSWRSMTKTVGTGSESGSGSADLDPDPDSHQNVMDSEHWRRDSYYNNGFVVFLPMRTSRPRRSRNSFRTLK